MIGSGSGAPGLRLHGRNVEPELRSETAVTGFVGIAERGPLHVPQPVFNWEQFTQIFGEFIDHGFLAEAVFGFFLNGGEKCWCVRVADPRDRSGENLPGRCPSVDLLLPASGIDLPDRNGDPTIRFFAINEGSWGNQIHYEVVEEGRHDLQLTGLRQAVSGSGNTLPVENAIDFNPNQELRVTHGTNPFVQKSYEVLSVDPLTNTITIDSGPLGLDFPAGSVVVSRGFDVAVHCGDHHETFQGLSMNEDHERYFARVINGDADTYLTRLERGNSILVRAEHIKSGSLSRFRPVAAAGTLTGGGDGFTLAEATLRNGSSQFSLRVVATSAKGRAGNGTRVVADRFSSPIALAVPLATGERDRFSSPDAQFFRLGETARLRHAETPSITETRTVTAVEPDGFVHLTSDLSNDYPIGSSASVAGRFDLSVFSIGESEPAERFRNLRMSSPTSDGFVRTELQNHSNLICADPMNPPAIPRGEETLQDGRDPGEIDFRYYTGYEADGNYFVPSGSSAHRRLGLATLERVDEVSLVAVPDLSRGVMPRREQDVIVPPGYDFVTAQKLVLYHCAKMGERMALLELEPEKPLEVAAGWPANFPDPRFAKFGALFYPWVQRTVAGEERWVPPCGVVAGAYSLSDQVHGVGKAPANLPLVGIVATQLDLDRAEHDGLNPLGVNCIRKLDEGKVSLMGSRTLAPQLNTRYVNARRVLLSIVKNLSRRLLWTVFEPNEPALWKRIEMTVASFLTSLVSKGMTASSRPGESFYVKCNEETNPTESTDAGRVVTEIGVALTAPAEFVVITARRTPESLNIIEEET